MVDIFKEQYKGMPQPSNFYSFCLCQSGYFPRVQSKWQGLPRLKGLGESMCFEDRHYKVSFGRVITYETQSFVVILYSIKFSTILKYLFSIVKSKSGITN